LEYLTSFKRDCDILTFFPPLKRILPVGILDLI